MKIITEGIQFGWEFLKVVNFAGEGQEGECTKTKNTKAKIGSIGTPTCSCSFKL